jgi:hypothetical protein
MISGKDVSLVRREGISKLTASSFSSFSSCNIENMPHRSWNVTFHLGISKETSLISATLE